MKLNCRRLPPELRSSHWQIKFKTPEERKEVFEAFLEHISQGFPISSFSMCSPETIKRLFRDYPDEMPIEALERAEAMREQRLWNLAYQQASEGKGNSATLQFMFRNLSGVGQEEYLAVKQQAIEEIANKNRSMVGGIRES